MSNQKESLKSKIFGKVVFVISFIIAAGLISLIFMFIRGDISIVFNNSEETAVIAPEVIEEDNDNETNDIEINNSVTNRQNIVDNTEDESIDIEQIRDEEFIAYVMEQFPEIQSAYDSLMTEYSKSNADIPPHLNEVRSKANIFAMGLRLNHPSEKNMGVAESLFKELTSIVSHCETLIAQSQFIGKDAIDTYSQLPTKMEYVEFVYNQVNGAYD